MHYQQIDRSMGLWIINEFLKGLIMQFVWSMLKGRTEIASFETYSFEDTLKVTSPKASTTFKKVLPIARVCY